jgi:hypothetical protein
MIVRTKLSQTVEQAPVDLDARQIEYNYEQPYDALAFMGRPVDTFSLFWKGTDAIVLRQLACVRRMPVEYTETRDDHGEQYNSGGTL